MDGHRSFRARFFWGHITLTFWLLGLKMAQSVSLVTLVLGTWVGYSLTSVARTPRLMSYASRRCVHVSWIANGVVSMYDRRTYGNCRIRPFVNRWPVYQTVHSVQLSYASYGTQWQTDGDQRLTNTPLWGGHRIILWETARTYHIHGVFCGR